EDRVDDLLGLDPAGERVEGQHEAVPQHAVAHRAHVVGDHVVAALEEGVGLRHPHQREGAAGARAHAHRAGAGGDREGGGTARAMMYRLMAGSTYTWSTMACRKRTSSSVTVPTACRGPVRLPEVERSRISCSSPGRG